MYIIGRRSKVQLSTEDNRVVYLAAQPCKQPTIQAARKEADRLAKAHQTEEFLIFQMVEGFQTEDIPVKINRYI